ncbi:MAG TPA: hypothetical protein PLE78_07240 [Flavobacteriales bacterium]|nr:hypothetical protein [Flavobacteriales bacterium]HQW41183.1 hypothetical protein [Flavobacteriales bacterium]
MTGFLDWFERHKLGVIGTLAMHSCLLFVFTLMELRTTPTEEERSDMRVEVISDDQAEEMIQQIEHPELVPTRSVTNATSNITAERTSPSYSPAKLEQRVETELREMEKAEFDRLAQERKDRGEEVIIPTLDPSKWNKELYMEKAAEPVKIEGATTVWHDLKGRVRADDVPGYLCKEPGRVALSIQVASDGSVQKAEFDASRSTGADECMLEHALTSAKRARFSAAAGAPIPQKGTLYFLFVPQ